MSDPTLTALSFFLSYFPLLVLILVGACFLWLLIAPSVLSGLCFIFIIYGLPVICYRIHHLFFPLKEGITYLRGQDYSPWWGSHQFQLIYIAIPVLETLLRLIPGVFSQWLRLWGSKVGREVYWTPGLDISDRGLLEIGDRVILGHRIGLYAHLIKPKQDNLLLYIKKIRVGNDVFIGGGSQIGPGVYLADGTFVVAGSTVYPNHKEES